MNDALKNVTSIFGEGQGRRALYEYRPFGANITAEGDMAEENKFRFSCEYMDEELGLIYYNYRHLNPLDGRWINRDPIAEHGGKNLYTFVRNASVYLYDKIGQLPQAAYSAMEGQDWMGIFAVIWHAFVKFSDGSTDSNIGPEGSFISAHTRYVNAVPVKNKEKSLVDGTTCDCATDEEREQCVKTYMKAPHSAAGYPFSTNCGSLVRDAFLSCCLEDPTPSWLWYPGGECNN